MRRNRAVALKVISANAATTELDNLRKLKTIAPEHPAHGHLPELLDHFEYQGPNGKHSCLVFEVLGENLSTFCRRMFSRNQLPSTLDKMIARQLISVVDFLQNTCGFIHTGKHL
jgi:serine/threonine-protein kinase SRPK3